MSTLVIRGVEKLFPARRNHAPTRALEPTDLTVNDNDFITILGPSGCGKSTLLRVVAGLETPTAGEVRLNGHPVTRPGPDRGMVFQSYTLFPWLSVRDNVCFGLRERGVPRAEQRAIADRFLGQVGLKGFENHYPAQLSGGMQQRTALARALANDPDILLLDEPFGALDHQTREVMQELLLGIWEQHRKTVLFVTHDMDEALMLGTRIVVMDHGRVVQADTPRAVLTRPANDFVRDFVGAEDRGLKLLSVETVGSRLRRGDGAEGAPVAVSTPLNRALSLMIVRGVDRLAVVDAGGALLGAVHLSDLALART